MASPATVTCPACNEQFTPLNPAKPVHHTCKADGTLIQMPAGYQPTQISPSPHATPSSVVKPPSTKTGGHSNVNPSGVRTTEFQIPDEVRAAAADASRIVSNYVLVTQIGRGGMGVVWKAWDRKLHRYIAIKFLTGTHDEDIMRFEREARLAAGMRHPNIAPIYEIGDHGTQKFIAMEYITGTSLDKAPLSNDEMISIMYQVCLAVDHAHKNGVIHRDLKPANIMLTKEKWPYVLDFGLAKTTQSGSTLSAYGMITGTPSYMPPEQAQGWTDKIDARSDIYSLGATLYHLMAGVPPFVGTSPMETVMKVINEDTKRLREANPKASEQMERIVHKALNKNPEQRYQTAAEMAADLKRFSMGESVAARPPSVHMKFAGTVRKNPVPFVIAGFVAFLMIGGGIAYMVFKGPGKTQPVIPTPAPIGGGGSESDSRKWMMRFRAANPNLNYVGFEEGPKVTEAATEIRELLRDMGGLTRSDEIGVQDWFKNQIAFALKTTNDWATLERAKWMAERPEAVRAQKWATLMLSVLQPAQDYVGRYEADFNKIKDGANRILDYKGTVVIRLFILPYATLQNLTAGTAPIVKDGKIVDATRGKFSSSDLTTPLMIHDLEVADFKFEFLSPDGKVLALPVPASGLENGKEYALTGSATDGASLNLKVR